MKKPLTIGEMIYYATEPIFGDGKANKDEIVHGKPGATIEKPRWCESFKDWITVYDPELKGAKRMSLSNYEALQSSLKKKKNHPSIMGPIISQQDPCQFIQEGEPPRWRAVLFEALIVLAAFALLALWR